MGKRSGCCISAFLLLILMSWCFYLSVLYEEIPQFSAFQENLVAQSSVCRRLQQKKDRIPGTPPPQPNTTVHIRRRSPPKPN
ncbi:hypothetical protein ES332_A07G102800v1 [Gossypium tomentosum]|uniref:Uncharacterized protein n=1 Tax=Gossypium tomentosum TaxID=34277 RepID=A0A5D2PRG5_GOSTO|nr:hypothetical protein ES332_A07G102800v1 [Gossypium tomentosum]